MLAEPLTRANGLMTAPDLPVVPAPWDIRGTGWCVLYRFEKDHLLPPGPMIERPELRGRYRGGVGALTWMQYTQTPVGPYDELLFIPGKFEMPHRGKLRRYFSISRIFVSSWESVVGGRANWGIPKDRADFHIEQRPEGEDVLSVSVDGETACEMVARPGLFRWPWVNNRFFPITLMQQWEGQSFFISLRMRTAIEWLSVKSLTCNPALMPDVSDIQPIGALKLDRFRITFPVPTTEPGVEPAEVTS